MAPYPYPLVRIPCCIFQWGDPSLLSPPPATPLWLKGPTRIGKCEQNIFSHSYCTLALINILVIFIM